MPLVLIKIFLIFSINAKTLELTYNNYHYQLNFDSKKIVFRDQTTNLSFDSKECNDHILKSLVIIVENYLSHPFLYSQDAGLIKLEVDHKKKYESPKSARGDFLFRLKDYIKSKKIEEELNCSK